MLPRGWDEAASTAARDRRSRASERAQCELRSGGDPSFSDQTAMCRRVCRQQARRCLVLLQRRDGAASSGDATRRGRVAGGVPFERNCSAVVACGGAATAAVVACGGGATWVWGAGGACCLHWGVRERNGKFVRNH